MTTISNNKLTDETLKAWKIEAMISLGETPKDCREYSHHEAIFALVTELQERRKTEAEPIGYMNRFTGRVFSLDEQPGADTDTAVYLPVYTAPPAPVVPDELLSAMEEVLRISDRDHEAWHKVRNGITSCRAAMLQSLGNSEQLNSPVTPDCWIPVIERMPERDVDVQVYCADKKEQMVGYMECNETEGWFRFASLPNGGGVYCKPTHWMPLPAAPQQEGK
ncbi:DUF551 domain-containing protein [Salmonella enterica subsp. enterica]|nr:DUF551 domain-containing protein [Salmonella enterica subsp. enterica]